MKKLILCCVVMLGLASCSDQLTDREFANGIQSISQENDEYHYYLEKARWGDAEAYVKLADYYHTGQSVNQDFIGMTAMLSMAEQFDGHLDMKEYFKTFPEDDCYRLLFETLENANSKNLDKVRDVSDRLLANNCPDGNVLRGIIQVEEGDTIGGLETIRIAADQGSTFGEFLLFMAPAILSNHSNTLDVDKMVKLAEKSPCAYKILGDLYAGYECDSVCNPELAASYYSKADEYGFLGRKGAKWLLDYYAREGIQIEELERQRLQTLSKGLEDDYVTTEDIPIVYQEQSIQEYVDSVTHYRMLTDGCKKAIVYVVETGTGTIIAHSSLEDTGTRTVPYRDTFNKENDYIIGGASYLALLWSGNVTPNTMLDTEAGVYEGKDGYLVRDHNWRRGGYGSINLEFALTHRSEVGFTKAFEQAYGKDKERYNSQISFYCNEQPKKLQGILTFYNAIANGGRMVKLCEPDDSTITVIHEQIAPPEYIRQVQEGLEHCVSEGLFRKAGNEYTDVAACGRSLRLTDNKYRLELCGYFPTRNPKYTIMVVMEKDGLPASAGGMCGPLFSQVVVGLLSNL